MRKFMEKLWNKKNSKKGFTLVELIVVLVILGILAAIMVPSMIGWINKAREKQFVLEARNAYLATQTVYFEKAKAVDFEVSKGEVTFEEDEINEIKSISLAEGKIGKVEVDEAGVITKFEYTDKDNKLTTTYALNAWTITPVGSN